VPRHAISAILPDAAQLLRVGAAIRRFALVSYAEALFFFCREISCRFIDADMLQTLRRRLRDYAAAICCHITRLSAASDAICHASCLFSIA